MRNIGALIIVLIIGFLIGTFTNAGENLFSFLNMGILGKNESKQTVSNEELVLGAQATLDKIAQSAQKETGPIFDKKYLDALIVSYESSVTLSKIGTVAGGHTELRTMAKNIARDDAAKLAQLKKWRAEWFPTAPAPEPKDPPFIKK